MKFDIFTLTVILSISFLLQSLAIYTQFRVNKRYNGLSWWVAGSSIIAFGLVSQLLRDIEPFVEIILILSNSALIFGIMTYYIGIMRFLQKRPKYQAVFLPFALYLLLFFYFVFGNNNYAVRVILVSVMLAFYSILTAASFYLYKIPSIKITANFLSIVFLFNGSFFVVRTLLTLSGIYANDYFIASTTQVSMFMVILIASTSWTFGFLLLISQRLQVEISETQSHFEVIFNTGPDMQLITRVKDGVIVDVNEAFCSQTGYSREEIIGKLVQETNIYNQPENRAYFINQLLEEDTIENAEGLTGRKDGSWFNTSSSAKVISLDGMPHIIAIVRDTSVQKRIERELQQSEKKYRQLIESANEAIFVIENGVIRLTNPMATNLTGYAEEELISMPFDKYLHPDDLQMVSERYQKRIRGEDVISRYQIRVLMSTGETRWAELNAFLIDWDGRPATLNFLSDVTERRKVEEALKESEALHRAMLNASPDGIVMMDSEGTIQMASPSFLSMMGFENEAEVLGKNFFDFIIPGDRQAARSKIKDIFNGINDGLEEYSVFRADGSQICIEANGEVVYDRNGKISGMVSNIRDISDRKEAEEALRQSESRFRLIAENTSDTIWLLDVDTHYFRYISPSVYKLRGYRVDEVINQHLSKWMTPESLAELEKVMPERLHLYSQGIHETFVDEVAHSHKNGGIVWAESITRILTDENGKQIILGVSRDITERKRLREELVRRATTDELTGAPNRRYFMDVAGTEMKRSIRHKHPLSLAIMDIDRFKSINDTYGHAAGDQALKKLTSIFMKNIREIDHFARIGGDEFILLLPETEYEQASQAIERIRKKLASNPMVFDGKPVPLKISVGISSLDGEKDSLDDLLGRADHALYQEKKQNQ